MTWRIWVAMFVGALTVAAGWWAAGEMFTEGAPRLGSVVVIGRGASPSPTPPHAPDGGEGAAEVPLLDPPSAGDDDDDVDDDDHDGNIGHDVDHEDVDHEDVDGP